MAEDTEIVTFGSVGISEKQYNNAQNPVGTFAGDLNGKTFSGYITLKGSGKVYIGGNAAEKGLELSLSGKFLVIKWASNTKTSLVTITKDNSNTTFDFRETEFLFGATFQKNGNNLDVAISVEMGTEPNKQVYSVTKSISNKASELGNTVSIICQGDNYVTVKNDSRASSVPNKDLEWISTGHFYVEDGTYGYTDGTVAESGEYFNGVENTYFAANVNFSAAEGAQLLYAGDKKEKALGGLSFMLSGGNLVVSFPTETGIADKVLDATTAGLTSFADTDFKLGVSIETVNEDGGETNNDIKLGIWFGDKLYNEEYIFIYNYAGNFGSALGVFNPSDNASTVKVGLVSGLEAKIPAENLGKITLDAFEIKDGKYSRNNYHAVRGSYSRSLKDTYFALYVKFNLNENGTRAQEQPAIIFNSFEADDDWLGAFRIRAVSANEVAIYSANDASLIATIKKAKTTVQDFTKEIKLGISTEIVDRDNDGEKNDVKYGFYFNDVICEEVEYNTGFDNEDGFLYFNNKADTIGGRISFFTPPSTSFEIRSVENLKAPIESRPLEGEGFNRITFDTFNIKDGVYKNRKAGNGADFVSTTGSYRKTYDKVCFSGTVNLTKYTFTNADGNESTNVPQLIYGVTSSDGWTGIYFYPTADGTSLIMRNTHAFSYSEDSLTYKNRQKTFLAEKTTVSNFIDKDFNIGISTRFVDHDGDGQEDDVQLGIWFNDILYNDEYIYYLDFTDKLGTGFSLHARENTTVTVKSREDFFPTLIPEEKPEELEKISLNYFAINDGTFKYNSKRLTLSASYGASLNNTYCEFMVNPSVTSKETSIRYAGSGWTGLLIRFNESSLYVYEASGRSPRYSFSPRQANTDAFAGKEYKMAISTQYLDLDGDGSKDDVRFGVWVNDFLCNNEYIDILDYVQYMGSTFALYVEDENANIGLKSVNIPINFEMFGFTSNWERELEIFAKTTTTSSSSSGSLAPQSPKTGNMPMRSMIFSCVALGGLIDTEKTHRRKQFVR